MVQRPSLSRGNGPENFTGKRIMMAVSNWMGNLLISILLTE